MTFAFALAFLPPKLVEAILDGTQLADMTADTLTRGKRVGLVCRLTPTRG